MTDVPIWEPDPHGVLWTYVGSGFHRKSIRNDALWAARVEVRNRNILRAAEWRDAAVADGWSIEPTYPHESVETAWRLLRDGFQVQGLTRPESDKSMPVATIHIWGPDGLAIKVPPIYAWGPIAAGVRTCSACGATDVETQRVGFAGRVCGACLPEQRRLVETPGWNS